MPFSLSFPLPLLPSFLLLSSILILYLLRPLFFILVTRVCSPLRLLPSPPSPSFFVGNLAQLADQENNFILHSWTEKYGNTFTYRGFLNAPRLFTIDPLALSYILGHAYDFPKPDFITDALAEMGAGHDGLITAHGDVHRRQVCLSPSQLALHCHSSHSDLFSAASWYLTFPSGDAICLFPDSLPIITEPGFLSLSHQIYHAYFSRKGRARVHSSHCLSGTVLTYSLH